MYKQAAMAALKVNIKHGGKVIKDLPLDTSAPPAAFKQVVYEQTGIPLDRMKVMLKGGMLKVCAKKTTVFLAQETDALFGTSGRFRLEEDRAQRGHNYCDILVSAFLLMKLFLFRARLSWLLVLPVSYLKLLKSLLSSLKVSTTSHLFLSCHGSPNSNNLTDMSDQDVAAVSDAFLH